MSHFARNRCSSLRTELQEDAAGLSRRNMSGFEADTRGRVDAVVAEVSDGITTQVADVAQVMSLPGANMITADGTAHPVDWILDAGVQRTVQAGGRPIGWVSFACELQRDWGRVETVPQIVEIVINERLAKGK